MSDEVTIKELVRTPPTDLLPWVVMNLLTAYAPQNFLERFGIDATNHDNTVKVELKINGVEVSPREVFAELERQHDDMVKREAAEMLRTFKEYIAVSDLMTELRDFAERRAGEVLGEGWKDRW